MSSLNIDSGIESGIDVGVVSRSGQAGVLMRLATWWGDIIERRRVEGQLALLSDRELNDIGLNRCDIDAVARGQRIR